MNTIFTATNECLFAISAMEVTEAFRSENRKPEGFEIVWLQKGKGILIAGGSEYDLNANMICCIASNTAWSYIPEQRTEGYYIRFSADFLQLSETYSGNLAWLDECSAGPVIVAVDEGIQYELEMVLQKMRRELANYFSRKQELLKGLLNIFLIYLSRNIKPAADGGRSRDMQLVRRFMNLLKENFTRNKLVSDYASQLHVTADYLNRTVKRITKSTVSYHIQQQIVKEAKRQAMYSSVSMKEVAYNLGFDNLAHFSKFFKNNAGINFTCFKRELQMQQG
jgi:AraC family transcriptional regulator, transcriptional activator of pobA